MTLLKAKLISIALAAVMMIPLLSCGKEEIGAPYFPAVPDRIVIGVKGEERTLLPGDEAFDGVASAIRTRAEKAGGLGTLMLAAHGAHDGKHMSFGLRESETFVEFVYDECGRQSFLKDSAGGTEEIEERDVKRLFFCLTGENHGFVFVGADDEYSRGPTLGDLPDDTGLILYVQELISEDSAAAE